MIKMNFTDITNEVVVLRMVQDENRQPRPPIVKKKKQPKVFQLQDDKLRILKSMR